ncbi:hypothetical protein [Micromonospora sp. WMMD710]|uniref:hypothetical protein n=1 Tax=Micromonospora sp. WMMD710 TaxID=3016085 RepID=UPI002416E2CE|nr:hypothetical protein [Micromonospora sp. WMMD710]MDG4762369.1 hypothetical protein [Micromonospora sp. WMMD710]MDG4762387.1 hypothetical protein [Micromonospora sp. WMMD710]MDG4762415.1 hypothetical protein [Micromonospora sp. WMMD710]MDG4762461.1 hypothetical protein [Micromonospora sp. WMMD710]MDG4762496.1 hypothetical protein [Micromonospora sp. WMMD710]
MMAETPSSVRAASEARYQQAIRELDALEARLADEHVPRRPEWECQTCDEPGTPWPCAPAQVRLLEAYRRDRIGLSMHVGALYHIAAAERPGDDLDELYDRIVGWIR